LERADTTDETEATGQHHRAVRRREVPAERRGHRAVRTGDRDERERTGGAVALVEHECAVPVVVEDLVVRDGPGDEARDEALELLRVHGLGVVLHHAEELLAADEEAERVLVADVDDARAQPSGLTDELVLEGAEYR